MSRPRRAAVLFAALVVLAACGASDNGGAVGAGPATSGAPVDLAVVVDVTGASGGPRSGSVTCRGNQASGTGAFLDSAAAGAVCAVVLHDAAIQQRLTSGPPTGRACTQQDGGPATARVTGTLRGSTFDAIFTRHGGCEISDWNALVALVGPP